MEFIPLERAVRIDVSSANCRAKSHFQVRTSERNPIFRCPPLRCPSLGPPDQKPGDHPNFRKNALGVKRPFSELWERSGHSRSNSGVQKIILGMRNPILGMASHDLCNAKTTILGETPGAIPGIDGNQNDRFSFAHAFSESFFKNCGGPCVPEVWVQEFPDTPDAKAPKTKNCPKLMCCDVISLGQMALRKEFQPEFSAYWGLAWVLKLHSNPQNCRKKERRLEQGTFFSEHFQPQKQAFAQSLL